MIVKVCGLREPDNIRDVEQVLRAAPVEAWYGFIFYPPSPRFVAAVPSYLPSTGQRTGVFVRASLDDIRERAEAFGLHAVQLYDVPPEDCRTLRREGLTVIRALRAEGDLQAATAPLHGCVDYFLFDTPTPLYGGSGQGYDTGILDTYQGPEPFLLSGGLGPDSVPRIRAAARHPAFAGIDLNSGFETAPARKAPARLREFLWHATPLPSSA